MPNIPIKNKISTRMYTFSKNIMKLHDICTCTLIPHILTCTDE